MRCAFLWSLSLACQPKATVDEPDAPVDTAPAATHTDSDPPGGESEVDSDPAGDSGDSGGRGDSAPPAPPAPVVLNELMALNHSTVMDESGGFPDWLELYNRGDEVVDLARVALVDSSGERWVGAGSLDPGARLLLWADDAKDAEGHLPFALDKDAETLSLEWDGVEAERLETGALAGDVAWARHPDGGEWAATIWATPGAANGDAPSESDDPRTVFFQRDRVTELRLYVAEELLSTLNQRDQVEVEGSLVFEDIRFEQVGVRLKGSGSYQPLDQKPAFKVDVNEFVGGQRLRGLKGLTLNNADQDATFAHEYMTYLVYGAAGYPASRVGWTRVYFNDQDYGIYVNTEDIDDVLLGRFFERVDEGQLWEGHYEDFNDQGGYSVPAYEYDEGPEPEDNTPLVELADQLLLDPALDSSMASLEALVDVEALRWYNALEALNLHVDGYQAPHNFAMYHDAASDLFYWIPWGTDFTWYGLYKGAYEGNGEYHRYCIDNPACLVEYDRVIAEALDLSDAMDLPGVFDEVIALIDADVRSDPRHGFSDGLIEDRRATTRALIVEWPAQMRAEIGLYDLEH